MPAVCFETLGWKAACSRCALPFKSKTARLGQFCENHHWPVPRAIHGHPRMAARCIAVFWGLLVSAGAVSGRAMGRCSPTQLLSPPCYDTPQPVQIVLGTWSRAEKRNSPLSLKRGHLYLLSWCFYTGFCNLFLKYLCFSAISSKRENHD